MAQGTSKIQAHAAAAQEARERAQQSTLPQLYTSHVKAAKGGKPAIVRFLEQGEEIHSYDRHEYQVPDNRGGFYRRQFTCLKESPWNQPECPGCQAGLKIKLRGVYNLIQRGRAVLRRGPDNKPIKGPDGKYLVDGYQDQVVILDVPSTTATVLTDKDGKYHGLMSRDLLLSDSGETFQPWSIEPADIDSGPQPMSQNDLVLMAQKHDLDAFMKPPSFDEALQIVRQYGGNSGANNNGGGQAYTGPQGNAQATGSANGFLAGAQNPQVPGAPAGAFGAAAAAVQPPAQPVQPPAPAQTVPAAVAPAAEPGVGQPVVPVVTEQQGQAQQVTQGVPQPPAPPVQQPPMAPQPPALPAAPQQ